MYVNTAELRVASDLDWKLMGCGFNIPLYL